MPMHLVAFGQSINPAAANTLTPLNVVPDPTVTSNTNQLTVPDKYNQVVYSAAIGLLHSISLAQLQSPSLREMFFPDIDPIATGSTFSSYPEIDLQPESPLSLRTNEQLQFYAATAAAAPGAQNVYGLVGLSDGPLVPTKGAIFSIHATSAITLAANTWVNGPLVFDQVLPVGNYDIVGMRAEGANLIAARLVFIGASALTRPGVPGCAGPTSVGSRHFRKGGVGVFGTFNSITPPSVDCLGATDTAQNYVFDLIAR